MKNVLLLLSAALLPDLLPAQMWCAPSSVWSYTIQGDAVTGSITRTFMGDTLFQGVQAQRIHEAGTMTEAWVGGATIAVDNDRFTYLLDSTLFLWTNVDGAYAWDTLFRFDAVTGDRWFPPGADDICSNGLTGMILVTSTGIMVVDGTTLRTWELALCDALGQPSWSVDPVVERIGHFGGLMIMPGVCIVPEYGETLSCYADRYIDYVDPTLASNPCSMVNAVEGIGTSDPVVISPVPGGDVLNVELAPGSTAAFLVLVDATGREALRARLGAVRTTVETSHLRAGAFAYRLMDEHGSVLHRGGWIKQ